MTTVHQDVDQIGARAVAALLHTIEQGSAPAHIAVPAHLVVRDSTAPPSTASKVELFAAV